MLKVFLSTTAALAIAGSTLAYAQERGHRHESAGRGSPNVEDLQSFADARLAALRAGLSLTAAQQAHWPAFEAAARELQKLRIDHVRAMVSQRGDAQRSSPDFTERMRTRGAAMADRGAALKKYADATGPLYNSLDDNQKRRFAALSQNRGRHAHSMGGSESRGRDFHHRSGRRG